MKLDGTEENSLLYCLHIKLQGGDCMAYRNMEQITERVNDLFLNGKKKYLTCYSMNIDEFTHLYNMCRTGRGVDALIIAFNYGFALGTRARERDRVPVL